MVFGHFKPYILHIEQIIDGIFYNMKALRTLYEQLGVEAYYKQYAAQYINPHLAQIQELLLANEGNLDYSSLLDLCAGGGRSFGNRPISRVFEYDSNRPFYPSIISKKYRE